MHMITVWRVYDEEIYHTDTPGVEAVQRKQGHDHWTASTLGAQQTV